MLPILQIGPLALQAPGLAILFSLWLGLTAAEKFAPRRGIHPETLANLVLVALFSGLVGARLAFAAQNSAAYLASPLSLLSPNASALDAFSGIAAALIIGIIYAQRKNLPLWPTLDALTPLFATLAIGIALANAASGAAYGMETDLPWGISLFEAKRHPTQLYHFGLTVLTLLWLAVKSKDSTLLPGSLFWQLVALISASILLVESLRADSPLLPGGFRALQIVAWLALALALWVLRPKSN